MVKSLFIDFKWRTKEGFLHAVEKEMRSPPEEVYIAGPPHIRRRGGAVEVYRGVFKMLKKGPEALYFPLSANPQNKGKRTIIPALEFIILNKIKNSKIILFGPDETFNVKKAAIKELFQPIKNLSPNYYTHRDLYAEALIKYAVEDLNLTVKANLKPVIFFEERPFLHLLLILKRRYPEKIFIF